MSVSAILMNPLNISSSLMPFAFRYSELSPYCFLQTMPASDPDWGLDH